MKNLYFKYDYNTRVIIIESIKKVKYYFKDQPTDIEQFFDLNFTFENGDKFYIRDSFILFSGKNFDLNIDDESPFLEEKIENEWEMVHFPNMNLICVGLLPNNTSSILVKENLISLPSRESQNQYIISNIPNLNNAKLKYKFLSPEKYIYDRYEQQSTSTTENENLKLSFKVLIDNYKFVYVTDGTNLKNVKKIITTTVLTDGRCLRISGECFYTFEPIFM